MHTPAPWHYDDGGVLSDDKGRDLAHLQFGWADTPPKQESMDNANLIAMAPVLLANLKLVLEIAINFAVKAGRNKAEVMDYDWAQEAQGAIDQAEGKTPEFTGCTFHGPDQVCGNCMSGLYDDYDE